MTAQPMQPNEIIQASDEAFNDIYTFVMSVRAGQDPNGPMLQALFEKFYPHLHWRAFDPGDQFDPGKHDLAP